MTICEVGDPGNFRTITICPLNANIAFPTVRLPENITDFIMERYMI